MGDNSLQHRFCRDVRQSEPLSSAHLRRYENQCTVSTDGPCLSLFFKSRSEDVLPGDPHWDGHQYALTPSAVCSEPGDLAEFGQPRCKGATLPRLNGGEHQAHALVTWLAETPEAPRSEEANAGIQLLRPIRI